MTKRADHRIPDSLSHPFGEAIILLIDWKGGAERPVVTFDGKLVPIGAPRRSPSGAETQQASLHIGRLPKLNPGDLIQSSF
jgi:hypothetical protein